jgi:hypothetical protein
VVFSSRWKSHASHQDVVLFFADVIFPGPGKAVQARNFLSFPAIGKAMQANTMQSFPSGWKSHASLQAVVFSIGWKNHAHQQAAIFPAAGKALNASKMGSS